MRYSPYTKGKGNRPGGSWMKNLLPTALAFGTKYYGKKIMDNLDNKFKPKYPYLGAPTGTKNRKRKYSPLSRGAYGKFAGGLPKGKARNLKSQSMAKYARKGSVRIQETVGSVADPDSVYLYAHSVTPNNILEVISEATVRKLLESAFKTQYMSLNNYVLQGDSSPTAGQYLLTLTFYDAVTGASGTQATAITANSTVKNMSDALFAQLRDYSGGYGINNTLNPREPFFLSVYKQLLTNTESIQLATMNLHNEYIELSSTLELKVQNRSLSASGGDNTDVVDSNPIQGYIYEFSSIPKSRDVLDIGAQPNPNTTRAFQFNSVRIVDGMNLVRGAQLPIGYREPITARTFTNCKGVTKIRLEPGNIKNCFRKFKKSINFVKFLHDYNYEVDTASVDGRVIKMLGGGVMLAFEDVINVNSTSNIKVTYEAERKLGCVLKTRGHTDMVPFFQQLTYDNVPA